MLLLHPEECQAGKAAAEEKQRRRLRNRLRSTRERTSLDENSRIKDLVAGISNAEHHVMRAGFEAVDRYLEHIREAVILNIEEGAAVI